MAGPAEDQHGFRRPVAQIRSIPRAIATPRATGTAQLGTHTTMEITPVARALGAIVSGVSLDEDLPQATIDRLGELLIEHQVLFFRDQPVTPQAQARFAARFGTLHVHPIY